MKEYKVSYLDLFDGKMKIKYYSTAWQIQEELYIDNKIEIIEWRCNQNKLKDGNVKY
jgi:hypothetical protein